MAKSTNKIVSLIREIVKQEVQKEVRNIFIKEGIQSMSQKVFTQKDTVMEVLPKPNPKPKKKVSYTKNPVLNDILNETARAGEMDDYPTMSGGTFDSSRMAEAMGYGNMMGSEEDKRKAAAVSTAQSVGVDPNNPAVENVMNALTKDYRGVMKALDKKQGK